MTLAGANTATPIFTAPNQADTLTFQLIVSDINGVSVPDTVTITVTAPTTESPIANAGPDQNVQAEATVTLNGSASTSQTASPLSFAWTQIQGPPVILTGADTANPTFTAPNLSIVLTFQLIVSDENGVSSPDTVNITVTASSVLFVTNRSPRKILSFTNPATLNGNVAPTTNLSGAQTMLNDPVFATVNSAGALNVTNISAVTIYNNPATANGNVAPSANILGPQTQLTNTFGISFDEERNLLYVANSGTGTNIVAFANATIANGNVAPNRTITSAGNLNSPRGIFLDDNDNLYVANAGAKNVLVFANASTLNGSVTPSRTISSASFTGALNDVFVDANNNLFVVNPPAQVLVFNNASTKNGNIMPDVILTVSGAGSIRCITVDSNGVGFITDAAANAIYSYNQIATRNGTVAPDRIISGGATQLTSPHGLFLQE